MHSRVSPSTCLTSLLSVLFFAFVSIFFQSSCAASCPVPEIRANGEFFKSDAVFTGTVLSIQKKPDTDDVLGGWFYRLRIEKMFRGPHQNELTVFTEDSDTRLPLEKDRKYLLFAYKKHHRLEIYNCGNSALASESSDSLNRLEKLLRGEQSSEIEGWVVAETSGIDVSGVRVSIRGRSGMHSAMTGKDGWFHFQAPPGHYKADFSSKEYYLNGGDQFWYDPDQFVVHPGECASLQFVSVRHRYK